MKKLKTFAWIALAAMTLSSVIIDSVGCAKKVPIHPGSINNLDSWAYDLLLVEQDVINQAKAQYLAGSLPVAAKSALNTAIDQYNVAEAAWQTYHKSGAGQSELQLALDSLVSGVGVLQNILHKTPTPVSPTGTLFIQEDLHVHYTNAA